MHIPALSSRLKIRVASKQQGKSDEELEVEPTASEAAEYLGTNKAQPLLQELSALFVDPQARNRLNKEV